MEYDRLHCCFYGYVLCNIHRSKMHTARQFKLYNNYTTIMPYNSPATCIRLYKILIHILGSINIKFRFYLYVHCLVLLSSLKWVWLARSGYSSSLGSWNPLLEDTCSKFVVGSMVMQHPKCSNWCGRTSLIAKWMQKFTLVTLGGDKDNISFLSCVLSSARLLNYCTCSAVNSSSYWVQGARGVHTTVHIHSLC